MPKTPESQCHVLSIQERSETQLYTLSVREVSKQKRWVSLGLWWTWRIWRKLCFSMILGFRWHPFNPTYELYGSFSKFAWVFLQNVYSSVFKQRVKPYKGDMFVFVVSKTLSI